MHNLNIMKENGVYKALYEAEPLVALGNQHDYDYDYYESISKAPLIVDWGVVVSEKHPGSSQQYNLQRMWSRSTIPYSLACEKILPRQDAYTLYGMTLELLSEFYHFWYLGIFIVFLVTIPYFILQTLIFGYSKESPLLKSLSPLISRGVLILILWYLSWLANSESENVEDLVTGLTKITSENDKCVDEYT